uniref:Uncharacterized protein n=1 Tax=Glossina pallidipes TaxID=7398 RepID=A0A1A9ZMI9_GLOPL
MQSFVEPRNENLNAQFEKSTPKVITYMIGCLQCQVYNVDNYYLIILQSIDELLKSMQLTSTKKLADLPAGVISCLWYPINYAGDFNTQVLALKLIWKLLQICDIEKQKEELEAIQCTTVNLVENQLNEMIQKGNMDTFESMARELLNYHNLNLDNEAKVYSLICQSLRFEKCVEFYRPLNSDKFWVDFNCSSRTLSFKGRYRFSVNQNYELIQVIIKIKAITIRQNTLIASYEEKIEFSKTSDELEMLNHLSKVSLVLSDAETDRLINNKYFYEHFKINTIDNKNTRFTDSDSLHENTDAKKEPTFAEKNVSNGNNVSFNENYKGNNALTSQEEVPELFEHGWKQEKDNNAINTAHIKSPNTSKAMLALESKDSPIKELSNKRKFFKAPMPQKTLPKRQNKNKTSSKPKKIKTPTNISKSPETINFSDEDQIGLQSPPSSRSLDSQTANDNFIVNISNYLKKGREFASPALPKDQQRANVLKRTNSSDLNHSKYSTKMPTDVYSIFDEI